MVYEYNKYLHSLRFRRQTRNRNGCHIKLFNESYPYADADDNTFCGKTGIYARGGTELSVGGLLMLGEARQVILRAMQSSPSITIEELSVICHLSQDGVRYYIKYLKSEGKIRRVGKKVGYWEILK